MPASGLDTILICTLKIPYVVLSVWYFWSDQLYKIVMLEQVTYLLTVNIFYSGHSIRSTPSSTKKILMEISGQFIWLNKETERRKWPPEICF